MIINILLKNDKFYLKLKKQEVKQQIVNKSIEN